MGNTKTTIELNGKRYDAITGTVIGDVSSAPKKAATAGANMDGFFKPGKIKPIAAATLPVPTTAKKAPASRAVKKPLQPHRPEKAKTLMRHVVKKPVVTVKPHVAHAAHKAPATPTMTLRDELEHQREVRAKVIAKSPFISRFGEASRPTVTKKTAPLAVTPAPAHPAPAITHHGLPGSAELAAAAKHLSQDIHHNEDMIAHALKSATSHRQEHPKKQRLHHKAAHKLGISPRAANFGISAFAALLLTGFIAYQNLPNVAMHMASQKAGFAANLPAYRPSGFSMKDPIQAAPGSITISFRSNSDNRSFSITQRPSGWTSKSLLDNYVATNSRTYQTYEDHGRTIYVYGDSNATWVNGGVWYQVEGKSALNTDQLLHIANSL